ncbi:hypothetical protein ES703_36732 [subsurface metagenome]|jgi:hypothetical protein
MVDIDYKKEKIGQILLSRDIITKEQLAEGLTSLEELYRVVF